MSEEYDEIPIEQGEDDQVSVDMDDYEDEEEQPNDASFYSMQMEDSGLCLSVSPINPCLVCVGCLDNSAKLITVDSTGVPQSAIDMLGHTDSVVSVKFNAEGSIIATGSYDCTIKLWNPTNGARLSEIDETGSDVEIISFHPTENVLVAGCADGSVWVWSIEGSEAVLRHMLRGHSHGAAVRTLSFLGRGNQGLLSTSEEGVAIVWNLTNGQIVHKTKSFGEAIVSASVHVSKPIYAIGLENGATYIIHAENGKILHKLTTKGSVESVCFSACGMLLAIATLEGILEIWHMEQLNGYPRHKIDLGSRLASELPPEEMPEVGFTKVVWHPDQSLRCLVSIGKSGRVDLWNAMTGEHLTQLEGHSADVMDVTMAVLQDPQGRKIARIISTCDEGYVKMFTVSEDSE